MDTYSLIAKLGYVRLANLKIQVTHLYSSITYIAFHWK